MTSSDREPFEIGGVPSLDLARRRVTVDIGYLSGEVHRQAFASIFGKMLSDNIALLADCRLTRVEAERPLPEGSMAPVAVRDLVASPARIALALYDSRNEQVRLEFTCQRAAIGIGVRFDNPEFWLES